MNEVRFCLEGLDDQIGFWLRPGLVMWLCIVVDRPGVGQCMAGSSFPIGGME